MDLKPKPSHLAEDIAAAPAKALEDTLNAGQKMASKIPGRKSLGLLEKEAKHYWQILGPGLTTGAADDDPSGIATYSQTGAQYGFQLLWLALFSLPLMSLVQEMSARIGMVTGRGLAGNIRLYFPRWVLYMATILLFAANTFNIGADLGAMAKGAQLLLPHFSYGLLISLFTILCLTLQIFTSYGAYSKYLKWLALVLFAYVFAAILSHLNWRQAFINTVYPTVNWGSKDQLILICAILGTTISPYLFFWQTSQEIEEETLLGKTTLEQRRVTSRQDIKEMRIDTWSGMLLSNIVFFFIVAACAGTLFVHGITNITSAAQAAEALRPFAGNLTYFLFAIGIIGVGMLAIPVLAGSVAYAMGESLNWKVGLYRKLHQARSFYGVIIFSMLVGLAMNFIGLDPIKALIYSAVANGVVAPIIILLILLLGKNKKVMGEYTNHWLTTAIGWIVVVLMTVAGLAAIVSLF